MMQAQLYCEHTITPIGLIEVTATKDALVSVYFVEQAREPRTSELTQRAIRQLDEYFLGQRTDFDLPLNAKGTDFQQGVWHALCEVHYGVTCNYGDIARKIDNPKAVRAVGLANSKNPLSVIVPCHRVIGKNGTLTGYAGGVDRKAWLLEHEKNTLKR